MKVNRNLMDVARGEWLISFEGISTYAPIAHKLLTGEAVDLQVNNKAILNVVDQDGRQIARDKNGEMKIPNGSVAIIDMIGPIMKYGDLCTYGAEEIVQALYYADRHPSIIGTVFNQDGPGGAVSAAAPFVDFGNNKKKPVAGLADQSCSLHFWALNAVSDIKLASNNISAVFGSVGIVSHYVDNRKYLEKLGYVFHEIYPEESKHKNEAFKLAMEGKYDMIKKEHLSPLAIKFQDFIRSKSPNLKEETGVLTGRTFGADEAFRLGMIDGIGNLDHAINMVHVMSESNHYK